MEGKKVLLVDDDKDFRDAVQLVLEHYQFEVVVAADGETALSQAQTLKPDLVILDVMMPKKDGYAVCYDLKKHDETASIPIIMLTSLGKKADGKNGAEMLAKGHGADVFLEKPVEPQHLAIKALELVKGTDKRKKSLVLVVDDDRDFTDAVKTILEKHEYMVSVAYTGEDGLIIAQKEKPDLVLLDVMLPGMDGYSVCKQLREGDETRSIPIMMLTAVGEKLVDPGYAEAIAVTHKADQFMQKPVQTQDLVKKVQSMIGPQRRLI